MQLTVNVDAIIFIQLSI